MQKFTLSDATGRWTLVSTILASSMAFIASGALNVALDALQRDLGATGTELLWIVNGYLVFLAALILVGGSLGDHFGRKRIFGGGIILFTTASAACGVSPSIETLVLGRMVQGVGAALMVPGSLALISALFADQVRGKAIGIWSSVSTITTIGGPIIGGFLVDELSWRYVFFINVPVALVALFALWRVPENRDEMASPKLDYLGAALITIGLGSLTYGFVTLGDKIGTEGANLLPSLVASVVGILALIAFVWVEAHSEAPMVDLTLFKSRTFSGANLMTSLLYAGLSVTLLFYPLNLIQVQGYSASTAGLSVIPFSIMITLLSPWAGNLVDRYGPRMPLTVGPFIVAAGFGLFMLPDVTGGPGDFWTSFLPGITVTGIGMGVTIAPLTSTVMGAVSSERSGIASGINNAVTRSSQVLSTAILGAVALGVFTSALTSRTDDITMSSMARDELAESAHELGNATPPEALEADRTDAVQLAIDLAFVDMFRVINLISAALAILSGILAYVLLSPEAEEPSSEAGGEWYHTADCYKRSVTGGLASSD
ncbi:MAG: MFS transporter [Chloroflexi bacterium]|nr:MFS transporter [Chloroflexota bacterium]